MNVRALELRNILCNIEPDMNFIVQCLLGLRDLEYNIYLSLLEKPGTPEELSERLKKSRSLIQRALQNLMAVGIVYRKPLVRYKGRAYEYYAVPKKEVKRKLRSLFKKWAKRIEEAIDEW